MDDISPLFALEAEQLMLDGKTDEAIELCNAGLLDYPDYPAAYAVLAQAYLEFEDYEAAKDSIKSGLKFFPNNPKLNLLQDSIGKSEKNTPLYQKPPKKDISKLDDDIFELEDEHFDEQFEETPGFDSFFIAHKSDEDKVFEETTEKDEDEQLSEDDIAAMFDNNDEEEIPEETTEKDEDEQLSEDDIAAMFDNNDEEEIPEETTEKDEDEQLSEDDIAAMFDNNDDEEIPEGTTEDDNEEELSEDDIAAMFDNNDDEEIPKGTTKDDNEEELSEDDIAAMFDNKDDEEIPEGTTEDDTEEELSEDDNPNMLDQQEEDVEETIEEDIEEEIDEQLNEDDIRPLTDYNESNVDIEAVSENQSLTYIEEKSFDKEELRSSNINLIPGIAIKPLSISEESGRKDIFYDSLPDFPDFGYDEKHTSDKEISILKNLAKQIKDNSLNYEEDDQHIQQESDENLIISETMANIYYQQGLISKAIEVYHQLSDQEVDPTKKEEFAKKIDAIINDQNT
jgi:hypothetical protein